MISPQRTGATQTTSGQDCPFPLEMKENLHPERYHEPCLVRVRGDPRVGAVFAYQILPQPRPNNELTPTVTSFDSQNSSKQLTRRANSTVLSSSEAYMLNKIDYQTPNFFLSRIFPQFGYTPKLFGGSMRHYPTFHIRRCQSFFPN